MGGSVVKKLIYRNGMKKFAILGCGFWSQFQLGAWKEIEGTECVALYNRTKSKAEEVARRFGVPRVYDDAENKGDDNFETVKLVWAAYESANTGKVVGLKDF